MKLRKKLILSCAALAACATTMVSTTYAWYTSNTDVSVGGVNGMSSEAGSNLLLISQDKDNPLSSAKNWSTKIAAAEPVADKEIDVLQFNRPGSGTEITLGGMNSTYSASDVSDGFITYEFFVKNASTKSGNLGLSITSIENTTTSLPTKSVIGDNHKFIGIAASESTYTVDMMRALCMEIEVATNEQETPLVWTQRSDEIYEMETHAALESDSIGSKTPIKTPIAADQTTNYSAHQYYNSVMGLTDTDGTTSPDNTADDQISINHEDTFGVWAKNSTLNLGVLPTAGTADTNNTYLKVTVKLFLNGWDYAAFDACQGQTFSIALKFTAIASA